MTNRLNKTVAAALTTALLAISSAPAMAGGQFSFGFAPSNPDQAKALGVGLQIFSLVQGLSPNGANAVQNGNRNAAGINQAGRRNNGLIYQEGDGHTGTIRQTGDNNTCGLFQFGSATNGQCLQDGNNRSAITTVFGF